MQKLETLAVGARFRLPLTGKTGTVLVKTRSSITVKYDGDTVRKQFVTQDDLTDPSTRKETSFESERRVSIAPSTEVNVL